MILAVVLAVFSLLALALLALLDHFDATAIKAEPTRPDQAPGKFEYYDAFSNRDSAPRAERGTEHRSSGNNAVV